MLRALLLGKQIAEKNRQLEALRSKSAEYEQREAELAAAIEELTAENTDEERSAVEAEVAAFETERNQNAEAVEAAEAEIRSMEAELAGLPTETRGAAGRQQENNHSERTVEPIMELRFRNMSAEQRSAFVAREDVKDFLERTRSLSQTRGVTGADLLIPTVMLDLLRKEVEAASKLLRFVRLRQVGGEARQRIMGAIPEGVWTEMCANLNDLPIVFNEVEVDGYKVGGYVAICNAALKDNDVNLAGEILNALGASIGKALDKAILYGTGTHMPIGIATRLGQESQPASWGTNAPGWTDLHTTNIKSQNIKSEAGTTFFGHLVGDLAIAKPVYSSEGLFWAMNRKTHLDILAKALAFDSSAALVAGVSNAMPVVGGEIVEFEDGISDYEIIGGFGGNYLLAEREGTALGQSEHVKFLQDQTVFKGTARYDGMPVAGEAFVIVNYNNQSGATSKTFEKDYANTDMNVLTVTAAAGTATGDTVLTVSNALADSPTYKYIAKKRIATLGLKVGDKVGSGWTSLTSGTTQVTAAAGVPIVVVELDANSRVVSIGETVSVPKT